MVVSQLKFYLKIWDLIVWTIFQKTFEKFIVHELNKALKNGYSASASGRNIIWIFHNLKSVNVLKK